MRRDVDKLRSLGYQIQGNPGVGGGYRLGGGTDVPPLLFEDDEAMAVAVVLGVSAAAAVPGIERGALTALAKLDRLLPPRLRAQLTALRAATVSLASPTEVVPTENLIGLAQACDSHQRVTFAYVAHDGRRRSGGWSPTGWWPPTGAGTGRLRPRPRRLAHLPGRPGVGPGRHRSHLPPPTAGRPGPDGGRGHLDVGLRLSGRGPGEGTGTRGDPAHLPLCGRGHAQGDHTRVEMGVDDFDWLAGYLIGLGLEFEVIEPVELRDHMSALADRLQRSHPPTVGPSPR